MKQCAYKKDNKISVEIGLHQNYIIFFSIRRKLDQYSKVNIKVFYLNLI